MIFTTLHEVQNWFNNQTFIVEDTAFMYKFIYETLNINSFPPSLHKYSIIKENDKFYLILDPKLTPNRLIIDVFDKQIYSSRTILTDEFTTKPSVILLKKI